jgi:hypothetical protein
VGPGGQRAGGGPWQRRDAPQEVFNHHAQALGAEDLEEIVADYSDDAIFITQAGVLRGEDGIRQAFTKLLGEIPDGDPFGFWVSPLQPSPSRLGSGYRPGPPRAGGTLGLDGLVRRGGR